MNDLSVTAVGPRLKQCGVSRGAAAVVRVYWMLFFSLEMIECNQLGSLFSPADVNENGEDDDVESLLVEKKNLRSEI